jgi:DNA-binding HxlR family transcriptional regulator
LGRLLPVCPAEITLDFISGRWKIIILFYLSQKTMRFSELSAVLIGISRRVLTQQLRQLEQDGLIHREVFAQVPPKVEYSMTEVGRTLLPVAEAMCNWGENYGRKILADRSLVTTDEEESEDI